MFEDRLCIEINKYRLLEILLQAEAKHLGILETPQNSDHRDSKLELTVVAHFKRCWHEIRLVLPEASAENRPVVMNMPLIKAIARGKGSHEKWSFGNLINRVALSFFQLRIKLFDRYRFTK